MENCWWTGLKNIRIYFAFGDIGPFFQTYICNNVVDRFDYEKNGNYSQAFLIWNKISDKNVAT